jgi:5-methylcytosine-specific restriction enzyme subunit McrC
MSIISGKRYNEDKPEFVKVTEFCKPETVQKKFTDEEIRIIQTEFNDKLELVHTRDGRHAIKTFQYVGYIVLPNHIISISPKISDISFINMVRYGLQLLELKTEDFPASDERQPNYYDLLVRFLLQELELILQRGLYTSYANYEDNLTSIRGKILFKEQILYNRNRGDKVFCSFSELTSDILENRVIKYTLFYLLQCNFIHNDIIAKLVEYYKRMDQVELMSIHADAFKSINYSSLNDHYRPILKICELILRDSSLDLEVIGDKSASSFTIDMNKLFEDFVANLLIEKLGEENIMLQQTEYPEVKANKLKIRLDIEIFRNGIPLIILDTKYKEYDNAPDMGYIAQLSLYSLSTRIKNCGLIYPGKFEPEFFLIKPDIRVHVLSFNLAASSKLEFEENCSKFVENLKSLPLK